MRWTKRRRRKRLQWNRWAGRFETWQGCCCLLVGCLERSSLEVGSNVTNVLFLLRLKTVSVSCSSLGWAVVMVCFALVLWVVGLRIVDFQNCKALDLNSWTGLLADWSACVARSGVQLGLRLCTALSQQQRLLYSSRVSWILTSGHGWWNTITPPSCPFRLFIRDAVPLDILHINMKKPWLRLTRVQLEICIFFNMKTKGSPDVGNLCA